MPRQYLVTKGNKRLVTRAGDRLVWVEGRVVDNSSTITNVGGSIQVRAINWDTNAFTSLAGLNFPNGTNPINSPLHCIDDNNNNRYLVLDNNFTGGGGEGIMTIDKDTLNRTPLTSNIFPNTDPPLFEDSQRLAIDYANNRVLVADIGIAGFGKIIAVDLTTGIRSTVNTQFNDPRSILVDQVNNRIMVMDSSPISTEKGMWIMDGASKIAFSTVDVPDTSNFFVSGNDIAFDTINNRYIVNDRTADRLMSVDTATGVRSVFSANGNPSSPEDFSNIQGISFDPKTPRVLVSDSFGGRILQVDLNTGVRTLATGTLIPSTRGQGTAFVP